MWLLQHQTALSSPCANCATHVQHHVTDRWPVKAALKHSAASGRLCISSLLNVQHAQHRQPAIKPHITTHCSVCHRYPDHQAHFALGSNGVTQHLLQQQLPALTRTLAGDAVQSATAVDRWCRPPAPGSAKPAYTHQLQALHA